MSLYTPDNFVILKIKNGEETAFKVLAGWSGGYLDGDSWKMNSGITKVEMDGDYYLFHGYTGSVYKCHKDSEQVRMNISGVLSNILAKYPDIVTQVTVEDIVT